MTDWAGAGWDTLLVLLFWVLSALLGLVWAGATEMHCWFCSSGCSLLFWDWSAMGNYPLDNIIIFTLFLFSFIFFWLFLVFPYFFQLRNYFLLSLYIKFFWNSLFYVDFSVFLKFTRNIFFSFYFRNFFLLFF